MLLLSLATMRLSQQKEGYGALTTDNTLASIKQKKNSASKRNFKQRKLRTGKIN